MKPILTLTLALLLFTITHVSAGTSGVLTYTVWNQETTITDCETTASGEVTVPASLGGYPVTSIGLNAFLDCVLITRVVLPDSITEIGNNALKNCVGITRIILPDSIEFIRDNAFYNCTGLASVIFPSGITWISNNAFQNCNHLSGAIFLGNAPTTFQSNVFSGCAAGFTIYYKDTSTGFDSPDWNEYTPQSYDARYSFKLIDSATANIDDLEITDYPLSETGELDIPSQLVGRTVRRIGNGAFSGSYLSRISLPDSITHIGNGAFYECGGLTTFTIPSQVSQIETEAFQDCWSLVSIYFAGDAPQLGTDVFDGVSSIEIHYLHENEQGFTDDDYLPWRELQGNLVEYNGPFTFSISREHVIITNYSGSISGSLTIPSSLVGKPVEEVGELAFYGQSNLTRVTFPLSLKNIRQNAFELCTSLNTLTIPSSVTSVDRSAFLQTTSLSSVLFNGNAPTLGANAFPSQASGFTIYYYKTKTGFNAPWYGYTPETYTGPLSFFISNEVVTLTDCQTSTSGSFEIPATLLGKPVVTMQENTFLDCDQLTSISLPASLVNTPKPIFLYCNSLEQITVDLSNSALSSEDGVLLNKNKTQLIRYPENKAGDYEMPSSVTSIAESSFRSNKRLTSVKMNAAISNIPEHTFWGSSTNLRSVIFSGDAPTSVGENTTFGASGTTPLLIVFHPQSASGYSSLWHGYRCESYDSRYSFRIENDGSNLIITDFPDSETGVLTIPKNILDLIDTTGIGDGAFMGCSELTEINLPSTIETIGANAFKNCYVLTHFTLPATTTAIADSTFENCFALAQMILPDTVTSIGKKAFLQCVSLQTFTIPSQVTNIGDYAFYACSNLDSVFFEGHSPSVGISAFAGSTNVTVYYRQENSGFSAPWHGYTPEYYSGPFQFKVSNEEVEVFNCSTTVSGTLTIPSEIVGKPVVCIGSSFVSCLDLTRVIMPDTIKHIKSYAFYDCPKLFTMSIPTSVTDIEEGAFSYCPLINSFIVDAGNSHYLSSDGILYNIDQTKLIRCPEKKSGSYTLPSQVTRVAASAFSQCSQLTEIALSDDLVSIGGYGFLGCSSLTHVTLPEQVNSLEGATFKGCTKLKWAVFLGNGDGQSRDIMTDEEFTNTSVNFRIYYLSTKSGFDSPTWHGYPTTEINLSTHPAAVWLLGYDLAYDANLNDDESGDGINLLMAYAFDLNPFEDVHSQLPTPVIGASTMELTYHKAVTNGILYHVEVSPDLSSGSWTTSGITQPAADANGNITAVFNNADNTQMFMRLWVESP